MEHPDLIQLIAFHRNGRSNRQLSLDSRTPEQVAQDQPGSPSEQRYQQLSRYQQKTFPEPPAIVGMAIALRVQHWVIYHAAAVGLGLDVPREISWFVTQIPPGTERLEPGPAGMLIQMIRNAVDLAPSGVEQIPLLLDAAPADNGPVMSDTRHPIRSRHDSEHTPCGYRPVAAVADCVPGALGPALHERRSAAPSGVTYVCRYNQRQARHLRGDTRRGASRLHTRTRHGSPGAGRLGDDDAQRAPHHPRRDLGAGARRRRVSASHRLPAASAARRGPLAQVT